MADGQKIWVITSFNGFPGKPKKVYNGQSQYGRIVLDLELTRYEDQKERSTIDEGCLYF